MSAIEEYDVVVVGLGPTGLMAAALLGQLKHRVAVIEKHPSMFGLPRAGHVDHEIVRTLQDLGVEGPFLEDAYPIEDYHWYNADREVILSFNWGGLSVSGFNSDYMMYQPVMEDAIVSAIRRESKYVSMLQGHEVLRVSQDDDVASLQIVQCVADGRDNLKRVGEPRTLRARYVIAADGARSAIREACGIKRDQQDFNSTWLDVDVFVKRPLPKMNPHQLCDPRRPAFISPLGKRHHRFEWCVLPGESVEDFTSPEKAWTLLAGVGITSDDVEIRRQLVYHFEAKVAESWRDGRILLAGDAAHTMPPFMGQGACSGMRDSANLAWKLDLILRGISSEALLDSYQIEREPHTRTWIDLSILSGEVSCTLDPEAAAKRDAALLAGTAPPMPAFPHLTSGALHKDAQGAVIAPAGELFLQREVVAGTRRGLFDDVVGRGFLLIGRNGDPRIGLSEADSRFLSDIGTTAAWIASAGQSTETAFEDSTGEYARLFDQAGAVAFIVRPDHYIFGAARSAPELSELIGQLKSSLQLV